MSMSIQTTRESYAKDRPDILDKCLQFGRVGASIRKGKKLAPVAPDRNDPAYEHDKKDPSRLTAIGTELYLLDVKDFRAQCKADRVMSGDADELPCSCE